MSLRNSTDDVRRLSETPLRQLIHRPAATAIETVPKLDIKNMFNKISPRRLLNKLSPTRSLNSSPTRHLDIESPKSTSSTPPSPNAKLPTLSSFSQMSPSTSLSSTPTSLPNSMPTPSLSPMSSSGSMPSSSSSSMTPSGLVNSSSCGSGVSKTPFRKIDANYLSRSASNIGLDDQYAKDYRRCRRDTFDEAHCYTCNVKIRTQDGILLALKCSCSDIKSFHNAYCRRVHWIYSQTCTFIHSDDLDKEVTLEDVFNQEHLYDTAESDSKSD